LAAIGAAGGWAHPAGNSPTASMLQGAATVAVTWMLVRELSPDGAGTALVTAAAAGAVAVLVGEADVAALASLMLASRILVRSTGLVPLLTDVVAVGVFGGVFARTPLAWAAGLAVAAAIALDTDQPDPAPARHVWLALAVGVAVTITAVFSHALELLWRPPGLVTVVLALAGMALLLIAPRAPSSPDDAGGPCHPGRVRAARLLAAGAALLGTLVGGGLHGSQSWPMWLGLAGAGVAASLRR
ncbi:MAG: hypothetical protein ACLFWM_04955, partial [Actinomycetota bacterium]